MILDQLSKAAGRVAGYMGGKAKQSSKKIIHSLSSGYKIGEREASNKNYIRIMKATNSDNWINGLHELIKIKHIDIDSRDEYGNTPLMILALVGKLKQFKFFLDYGADIHAKNDHGSDCLNMAIGDEWYLPTKGKDGFDDFVRGKVEMVDFLLRSNFDVNRIDNDGETPLIQAVSSGKDKIKIIEFLLKNGADIGVKNKEGDVALGIATKRKYEEIVELLSSSS